MNGEVLPNKIDVGLLGCTPFVGTLRGCLCNAPIRAERLGGVFLIAVWCGKDSKEETAFLGVFSAMERIRKSFQAGSESGAAEEEMRGFLFHGSAQTTP